MNAEFRFRLKFGGDSGVEGESVVEEGELGSTCTDTSNNTSDKLRGQYQIG